MEKKELLLDYFYIGDVFDQLKKIPSSSVRCCVTSPPYYALRDYSTATWIGGDEHCNHIQATDYVKDATNASTLEGGKSSQLQNYASKRGAKKICGKCGAVRVDKQIGLEKTPAEYIEKMVRVFREVHRILSDDGTLWINIGDSYCGYKGDNYEKRQDKSKVPKSHNVGSPKTVGGGIKQKDLIGIPWMLAFALRADGWWLRQDIIWSKCLSGGTWLYVRSKKGDMPMMLKDVIRLKAGTVKLWNGKIWTELIGFQKNKRSGNELEIVLRSGERISCTKEHRFPTNRGLLHAEQLNIGDQLIREVIGEPTDKYNPKAITKDVAWLIGLFLAEGSYSRHDCVQISGNTKEIHRIEKCKKIASYYGGSVSYIVSGNKLEIRMTGKLIISILRQYISGKSAKDKGVTTIFWKHSNEWIRCVLDGYLEGDGHWDKKNKRWRLGFCRNYNLERDLRTISARLNLHIILNSVFSKNNQGRFPSFRGELRLERSGHFNQKKPEEIVEIRLARCRYVYDIQVKDDPNLFCLSSGILTHNSTTMPESVTDRCTKSHEYIFLFSKQPRYFYDSVAIRQPLASSTANDSRLYKEDYQTGRPERGFPGQASGGSGLLKRKSGNKERKYGDAVGAPEGINKHQGRSVPWEGDSANKRSVWTMTPAQFSEAHFATFPDELPATIIKAGTSQHGKCASCGSVYVRDNEYVGKVDSGNKRGLNATINPNRKKGEAHVEQFQKKVFITNGWKPTCKCNAEVIPDVVLDPFMGAGTTALVAKKLERNFIGVELSEKYVREIAIPRLIKEVGTMFYSPQIFDK